ncbi:hypothetical protein ACIP5N_27670 [Streptomyces sp. NPDC088768]|uniref:hypothetical protein n=1 Tax=Streptomyces sp. NPDC088768 TaxID=3365894 RepID=UPI00380C31B8
MGGTISTVHSGGSRFYQDTASGSRVPGVTSIIGMLAKPYLPAWAAKMAAEAAVDNLRAVTTIAATDRTGAVDFVKNAHRRYTASRADIGSAAHDIFERMIRDEPVGEIAPELDPYRRHFAQFLDAVQPELIHSEDVAWSDTNAYAGSFDALLRIRDDHGAHTVIVDWKTGKATYPEVGLQLAAYAHADRIITPEGESVPMPPVSTGAVLHITDRKWEFKPVRCDESVFSYFLALRKLFRWDRQVSKEIIGVPFASGGSVRLVTGTERRASR